MKTFILIALLIGIVACQQRKEPKQTEPSLSLVIADLNYSAYSWYFPTGQWEFYLDYYLHVDKHGKYELMLRDSLRKPKYYVGIINDTIGKLIDKTFAVDTFKTDYKSNALMNIAYDGYTYCLEYKKDKEKEKKIIFIDYQRPKGIKALTMQLDKVFNSSSKVSQVDTVEMKHYIEQLKKFSSSSLGTVPKLEKPKFEPKSIRP